jgi:CBS-domain-containing membrane protein
MRSEKDVQQKLDRLKLALDAHQTQIARLGRQDPELLALLRAEQHMLLTEIQTLTWVLAAPRERQEPAYESRLDHLPVLDHLRVGAGR